MIGRLVFCAITLFMTAAFPGVGRTAAGVDAPELAHAGPFSVGLASAHFVQPAQPDIAAYDGTAKALPRRDRTLDVDIWYPAAPAADAKSVVYAGALTGEDGRDVGFTAPGTALRDAKPTAGRFPLVILAHGYGGTPVAMSWLAENLASKGYVVVGPHFADPTITEASSFVVPVARRPLDVVFVAAEAQRRARAAEAAFATADPTRTILIGYSMGGYGALTAAGGRLDTRLAELTHGALTPYVQGGAQADALAVHDLKAVVAIAPWSRLAGRPVWVEGGLSSITSPTLFIVGDQDTAVGYAPGVKTLFEAETRAARYLLTFENAGHSIGMIAAPEQMRARLWDLDWFEDPVWRKDRVIAIQLHFITAFLDSVVKGDAAKAGYLRPATVRSNDGAWPLPPDQSGAPYDAVSTGAAPITVWKGFKRGHAVGLELRFAPAAP